MKKKAVRKVSKKKNAEWLGVYASEIEGWNPEFLACDYVQTYICSRCKYEAIRDCNDEIILSYYCPNCGEKMKGAHMKK